MNNKHSPALHPQSRVALLGCPIHGLVKGGQITLANSTTRAYPQPAGSFDMAGATWSVERPGVPAVTLTPEQAAEASTNGWQWRNRAMLSGAQRQLYAQVLGGWLYIDPAGDRWVVTNTIESQSTDFVSPISATVTLTRFGDFGLPAESHTYPVTLASLGQAPSQPDPLQMYDPFYSLVEIASAGLDVYALSPAGDRAAIMINTTADNLPSILGRDLHYRYALGWLELSIAGPGASASVSLGVLRTRAQTLQVSATVTNNTEFKGDGFLVGTISDVYDWRYIMGMHWSGASWGEFAVSCAHTYFGEGDDLTEIPLQGGGTAYTRDTFSEIQFAITLEGPAGSVVLSGAATTQETQYEEGAIWSFVGSSAGTVAGVDISATRNESGNTAPPPARQIPSGLSISFNSTSENLQTELLTCIQSQLTIVANDDVAPWNHAIDIIRYSANVYGLRWSYMRGLDGPTDATFSAAVSPSGLHGGQAVIPQDRTQRYYGSWCPHTGQAVWRETQAVCWV